MSRVFVLIVQSYTCTATAYNFMLQIPRFAVALCRPIFSQAREYIRRPNGFFFVRYFVYNEHVSGDPFRFCHSNSGSRCKPRRINPARLSRGYNYSTVLLDSTRAADPLAAVTLTYLFI